MIGLKKYANLLDERVEVTCLDGKTVIGEWTDWLSAEDASEDERQEESILIQAKSGELVEVYLSEIKTIRKN